MLCFSYFSYIWGFLNKISLLLVVRSFGVALTYYFLRLFIPFPFTNFLVQWLPALDYLRRAIFNWRSNVIFGFGFGFTTVCNWLSSLIAGRFGFGFATLNWNSPQDVLKGFKNSKFWQCQRSLTIFISQTELALAHVAIPIYCERRQLNAINCKYHQIVQRISTFLWTQVNRGSVGFVCFSVGKFITK